MDDDPEYSRRGGGEYRPKRRRDEGDDDNNHQHGPPRRRRFDHHHHGPPSRPHKNRLREGLIGLGEPSALRLSEAIHQLGPMFVQDVLNQETRFGVFAIILSITIEQSIKIPFLATVIQHGDTVDSQVGDLILEFLISKAQQMFIEGRYNHFKLVIRLLMFLQPLMEGFPMSDMLESLMTHLQEIQQGDKLSPVVRELLYIVLITLPYFVAGVWTTSPKETMDKAVAIAAQARTMINDDTSREQIVTPFLKYLEESGENNDTTSSSTELPYPQVESLELLSQVIVSCAENEWVSVKFIPSPWREIDNAKLSSPNVRTIPLEGGVFLKFPETLVDTNLSRGTPSIFFQAFANLPIPTTPQPQQLEAHLLRDAADDIQMGLDFNRQEVARLITALDLFFSPDYFAPAASTLEILETYNAQGRPTWKIEDVAIESLFNNLFKLPNHKFKSVYFHSVLIETCLLAPQAIAPVFGRIVTLLHDNIQQLDLELVFRLIDWFSQHLSNFAYVWKWPAWVDDLKLSDIHPTKAFIRNLLAKEVRLSFYQRVRETLPEEFISLLQDPPDVPVFEYDPQGDNPLSEETGLVLAAIRRNDSFEEMQEDLNAVIEKAKELILNGKLTKSKDANFYARDVFVKCVCQLGSRSLSHADNWMDKTKDALMRLCTGNQSSQYDMVVSVMEYWNESQHIGIQILNKLVNYTILSPSAVIDWLVSSNDNGDKDKNFPPLSRLSDVVFFECLTTTLDKVKARIIQINHTPIFLPDGQEMNQEQLEIINQTKIKLLAEQSDIYIKLIETFSRGMTTYEEVNNDNQQEEEKTRWIHWWSKGYLRIVLRRYQSDIIKLKDKIELLDIANPGAQELISDALSL